MHSTTSTGRKRYHGNFTATTRWRDITWATFCKVGTRCRCRWFEAARNRQVIIDMISWQSLDDKFHYFMMKCLIL